MSANQKLEIQKSLVIAGGLILALAVSIVVLAVKGRSDHEHPAQPPTHQAKVEEQIPTTSRPALVRGADRPKSDLAPRQEWALEWQGKMRAKGRTIAAQALGEEFATLEFSWTQKNVDREHIEDLKKAEPFFVKLRALGFRKLIMRVDQQQVWSKELAGHR